MYTNFKELLFFTATNLNWFPLLDKDIYKSIIADSLSYMCKKKRCSVYGFVIMPNHIHLIMDLHDDRREIFQRDFLKYTAQQGILTMKSYNDENLKYIRSTQNDRIYQFWERRPMWLIIDSEFKLLEKMAYVHNNPVKSSKVLCDRAGDYYWSSASSYQKGEPVFDFLELLHLGETAW
jgi:putative transposase